MSRRRTMRIPAPIALPGERVAVPNYRRPEAPEEVGVVESVAYNLKTWSYGVRLLRVSPSGRAIRLQVSDHFFRPRRVSKTGSA